MSNEKKFDKTFLTMLNEFEEAVRAHEFKGSQNPSDFPAIENEYKLTRLRLLSFLGVADDT